MTSKIFDRYLSAVIFVTLFAISHCESFCNHTTLICVTRNSSVFDGDACCNTVTVSELFNRFVNFGKVNLILVFQPGTHIISNEHASVSLRYEYIVIEGHMNLTTIVRCANSINLSIKLLSRDTKLRNILFKNCQNFCVQLDRLSITSIEIKNCVFVNSSVTLAGNHRFESAIHNVHIINVHIINSLLKFEKVAIIRGQNSGSVAISCVNSFIQINIAPNRKVEFNGLYFQKCDKIWLHSRSRYAVLDVINTRLTNSCLNFEQRLTNSNQHATQVAIRNVTFDRCSCKIGSLLYFSKPKIHVNVALYKVNVTNSHTPLVKSKNIAISIDCCYFYQNKNFIIYIENSELLFRGANNFFDNTVTDMLGALIYAKSSSIMFKDSNIVINQNKGLLCGGIVTDSSQILFQDNVTVTFSNNRGLNGGALSLYRGSNLIFNATESNVALNFVNNTARTGGAIYVEDSGYNLKNASSVFHVQGEDKLVKLFFRGNSALLGGNQIYGGWIDWPVEKHISDILEFSHVNTSNFDVASDPVRGCLCIDHKPNCSITNYNMKIHGCALKLDIVTVGQRFTPVIGYVKASLKSKSGTEWVSISRGTDSLLNNYCTTVRYEIDSGDKHNVLLLTPLTEHAIYQSELYDTSQLLFQQLNIQLEMHNCTVGFVKINCQCVCSPLLSSIGLSCYSNATELKINVGKQQWVGITESHTTADEYPGVIAHQYCPFDYCKTSSKSLLINLGQDDIICAFNRAGILCGGCKTGFSRVLGSSKCKKCSNLTLFSVIPSGILAGLILIVVLIILNLTVSVGTINGLIFYSNFIQVQRATFFTPDSFNSFLSMFITWLNLDLGIESCLYDGLDSYAETWLQFCFPLYIWLLAILIIISSHYSSRISRFSSRNALQVLATLFLLSYTKLLRLVIDVVSVTTLKYPDGYTKTIWLYDGNIDFMKGKHIPLFLTTLLLLCLLSLPYTFALVSIQFLHKISHYRAMFWIHKLKPFFDAYTGPYRANHRYWTGLLLVIRTVLLVIFSLNQDNNPTINLICIAVFSFILLAWLYFTGWVYESLLNNCLEFIFLLNLGLTSIATLFSKQHAIIYTSTGIAFVIFIGIIHYHAQRQLFQTRIGAKLKKKLISLLHLKREEVNVEDIQLQGELKNEELPKKVTYTVVGLTQPLLEEEKAEEVKDR